VGVLKKRLNAVIAILLTTCWTLQPIAMTPQTLTVQSGPYLDGVRLLVLPSYISRVTALQSGNVHLDAYAPPSEFLEPLQEDPNIDFNELYMSYDGALVINCDKYPLNLTAFRRAFAFAYNKSAVQDLIVWDDYTPYHDSIVPRSNALCAEDNFDWHYYDQDLSAANALLDAAGFEVNGTTGWRDAPDGSPLEIRIECASVSDGYLTSGSSRVAELALRAVHVNATWQYSYYGDLRERVWSGGDYDIFYCYMYTLKNEPSSSDLEWLCDEFWSGNTAEGENLARYSNSTFDACRQQYYEAMTAEDMLDAATNMQKVLHETVPWLITLRRVAYQAYRTDVFEDLVVDAYGPGFVHSIASQWSFRKLHLAGSQTGGVIPVAIPQYPTSFNIFLEEDTFASLVFDLIYSSLYDLGPSELFTPDLARSMVIETHAENLAVAPGRTRFTIDMVRNAFWSDGTPLTAEDVAFTFNYLVEANTSTVHYTDSWSLDHLQAAYAPTNYLVVLEFSGESFLHFYTLAPVYILPKHIFLDQIGVDGWQSWNPVYNESEPHVTSGAFRLANVTTGDSIDLFRNPDFYYLPEEQTTETESSTAGTTTGSTDGFGVLETAVFLVSAASVAVIVVFSALSVHEIRKRSD
jgi:ABC-type transport system substrate-binding protein